MNFSKINTADGVNNRQITQKPINNRGKQADCSQNIEQITSKTSRACSSYGLAQISFGGIKRVQNTPTEHGNEPRTLNLFYFSDTHGELSGLTKLAATKEACEEFCGGDGKLTVLGGGDLISGSQDPVIQATVAVVNKMGMQATAMGNHERSRNDAKLQKLSDDLDPELLSINASPKDKGKLSIGSSMVCKQGDMEFLAIGASPLSRIQDPKEIAEAIDKEVQRVKEHRASKHLDTNLPVIFLSHMGSDADKIVAQSSKSVDLILGGHTHKIEDNDYVSASGKTVKVIQSGANNQKATVVKLDIAPDGKIATSAMMVDLHSDLDNICSSLEGFYSSPTLTDEAKEAGLTAEKEVAETVADNVGPKVDVTYVPEGQGYVNDGTERNYCNPVSNIMADAMLEVTADRGVQVSFFNAPSLKDTAIPDKQSLSNYDIIGRMLPFGGELSVADIPISKLYEILEKNAQSVTLDGSQLIQCGGMSYSLDANKAKARNDADVEVARAEENLKKAKEKGIDTKDAEKLLAEAQARYDGLPPCVEKILILNPDGSELKINPKAIKRGDFDGQTIKCVTNDYFAYTTGISTNPDYHCENTGLELTHVFEDKVGEISKDNDDQMYVDHNDVRISIKDKDGLINGYAIPTGLHTKYWYK